MRKGGFVPAAAANKINLRGLIEKSLVLLEAFQNELSHDSELSEEEFRLFLYSLHLLASLNPLHELEKQILRIRHETEQNHKQIGRSAKADKVLQLLRQLQLYLQKYLLDLDGGIMSFQGHDLDREKLRAPTTIIQQLMSLKGLRHQAS